MNNTYKIDSSRTHLWDLSKGIVYHVLNENDDFITISHNSRVGLFFKRTKSIIIPTRYDSIGGPFPKSIPDELFGYKPLPFEIHLGNHIGVGSIDGVLLEPIIDEREYRVYPKTFREDIVAVELAGSELSLSPEYRFLDTGNGNISTFSFKEIRSGFKDGKATVSNGHLIMEIDKELNIISDYPAHSIGFNDEIYLM